MEYKRRGIPDPALSLTLQRLSFDFIIGQALDFEHLRRTISFQIFDDHTNTQPFLRVEMERQLNPHVFSDRHVDPRSPLLTELKHMLALRHAASKRVHFCASGQAEDVEVHVPNLATQNAAPTCVRSRNSLHDAQRYTLT